MEQQVVVQETTFGRVVELFQKQLDKMCKSKYLFLSSVSGHQLFTIYLESFLEGNDPVFRDPESSIHNCDSCKAFIRRYGNIMAVDEQGGLITLFDGFSQIHGKYRMPTEAMANALQVSDIVNVFYESLQMLKTLSYEPNVKIDQNVYRLGTEVNHKQYSQEEADKFKVVKAGEVRAFHHFYVNIPNRFIITSGTSIEAKQGKLRDKVDVFSRAIHEIPAETYQLALELIAQKSLVNADSYRNALVEMQNQTIAFDELKKVSHPKIVTRLLWVNAVEMSEAQAKFRNTLMGTFCVDVAAGKDLDEACLAFNKRSDPANYMNATKPITERQKKEATAMLTEGGYIESFDRRMAVMHDIVADEIRFMDVHADEVKTVTILDKISTTRSTASRHKKSEFHSIDTMSIDTFMKEILPKCTEVELFLESEFASKMVSLTATKNKESKPIFKWSNNFSQTFNGDFAGESYIKQAVKNAGGNIDGIINARLAWNQGGSDTSDLDLHTIEKGGVRQEHIYYASNYRKRSGVTNTGRSPFSGQLDIDNTHPGQKLAVENITWIDEKKMKSGKLEIYVRQFSPYNSVGFESEIQILDKVYTYQYQHALDGGQIVKIADITMKNGEYDITHYLTPVEQTPQTLYNLKTEEFHRVNLMCLSPNHWGSNKVGNKHFLFMLENCEAPDSIRGFHNVDLLPELLQYKNVMNTLGSIVRADSVPGQLSGVGFNAGVPTELVLRLKGTFKRVVKVVI